RVLKLNILQLSTFAFELESHLAAFDFDVVVLQRGQPVRLALLDILVVSDPHARSFQQLYDRRENFVLRQTWEAEILLNAFPDSRQRRPEREHPAVFGLI